MDACRRAQTTCQGACTEQELKRMPVGISISPQEGTDHLPGCPHGPAWPTWPPQNAWRWAEPGRPTSEARFGLSLPLLLLKLNVKKDSTQALTTNARGKALIAPILGAFLCQPFQMPLGRSGALQQADSGTWRTLSSRGHSSALGGVFIWTPSANYTSRRPADSQPRLISLRRESTLQSK